MIRLFFAALLLATLPAVLEARADAPTGYWLTEKKGIVVNLYECGEGALCGRTVWLKKPRWKDGTLRIDERNPDPALRARPWCGIEVITGLRPDGDGGWTDGLVYDPKTGERFDFDLSPDGDGLRARGYLGVPALGKKEHWTPADLSGLTLCDPV
ncbi:MAG: DUF2147 domain-containing protein [Pikeienuella sp.]